MFMHRGGNIPAILEYSEHVTHNVENNMTYKEYVRVTKKVQ